mgnify:CR=1 FL=1
MTILTGVGPALRRIINPRGNSRFTTHPSFGSHIGFRPTVPTISDFPTDLLSPVPIGDPSPSPPDPPSRSALQPLAVPSSYMSVSPTALKRIGGSLPQLIPPTMTRREWHEPFSGFIGSIIPPFANEDKPSATRLPQLRFLLLPIVYFCGIIFYSFLLTVCVGLSPFL